MSDLPSGSTASWWNNPACLVDGRWAITKDEDVIGQCWFVTDRETGEDWTADTYAKAHDIIDRLRAEEAA